MRRGLERLWTIGLLAGLLGLAACTGSRYVLRTEVGNELAPIRMVVRGRPLEIEGRDGRLLIDGRDHGPLEPGDRLALDANGVVYVNGEPRRAVGQGE